MNKLGYYILHVLIGFVFIQFLTSLSPMSNIIGLALLCLHAIYIYYYLHDSFLFFIYIFSLSIVHTTDKIGGIVLVPFLIFLFSFFQNPKQFKLNDKIIRLCLIILVIVNILGYLINNTIQIFEILGSFIIFFGSILSFLFIQNFKFSKSQINIIIKIFTLISVLLFIVALNQKYVLINSNFVLLGGNSASSVSLINNNYSGRLPSLFLDYELFSEFALLMFILSMILLVNGQTTKYLKVGIYPLLLAFFSFLNMLITGTRSSILLTGIFILILFIFKFRNVFTVKTFLFILIIAGLTPLFIKNAHLIGLDVLIDRMNEINIKNLSVSNITTGEEINRAYVYAAGYQRMSERNWIIGYGYGTGKSNALAWFGDTHYITTQRFKDFHSLYLCIPMIYGWFGGAAYLFLIIYIIILTMKKYIISITDPVNNIALAFSLLFVFFLINQIKINSLRLHNYHFLIWLLMGFALSVINLKTEVHEDSLVH